MKHIISKFNIRQLSLVLVYLIMASCSDEPTGLIKSPSSVVINLQVSKSTIVLDSANAATTVAQTFSWNAADFGADLSVSYILQLDSVAGNFEHPLEVVLQNGIEKSYTKKSLNDLALSFKIMPGEEGLMKARVKATVSPNVEAVFSNVASLTITPYSTKPTPKYPVPDKLFLVGDATPGDWSNPVPVPTQQFTKIDETSFGIVIQLIGGKHYLLLPFNGDWGSKYNVASASADPAGDSFEPNASNDIPSPAESGLYMITVDFLKAKYIVTAVTSSPVPASLFIVGDATPGDWSNPVPVPSQQFTQTSNAEFQISLDLVNSKSYLFLPVNGDWNHKYGGIEKASGDLLTDGEVPGSNTPAPDVSAKYTITVNFLSMKYSVQIAD